MFNILGKLPASSSVSGKIDKLDIQKTVRLVVVVFCGAFLMKIHMAGDWMAIFNLFLADRQAFTNLVVDAMNAGTSALVAGAFELLRRVLINHTI